MNIAADGLDDTVGSAVRLNIIFMYTSQQPYHNLASARKFTSMIIQFRFGCRLGHLSFFRAGPRF